LAEGQADRAAAGAVGRWGEIRESGDAAVEQGAGRRGQLGGRQLQLHGHRGMTLRSPVGVALLLATLVSSSPAQVPTGHVAWHDLITPDLEVSKAFYSGLF